MLDLFDNVWGNKGEIRVNHCADCKGNPVVLRKSLSLAGEIQR
jgi:hypothetical protein